MRGNKELSRVWQHPRPRRVSVEVCVVALSFPLSERNLVQVVGNAHSSQGILAPPDQLFHLYGRVMRVSVVSVLEQICIDDISETGVFM